MAAPSSDRVPEARPARHSGTLFVFYLALWAAVALSGLLVAAAGVRDLLLARSSLGWPETPGLVVSSEVTRGLMPSARSLPIVSTSARIEYAYAVGPLRLRSARVSFMSRGFLEEPEMQLRRYPAGAAVTVRYDPRKPQAAVLEPGGAAGNLVGLWGFAALLTATGGIFLWFPLRRG